MMTAVMNMDNQLPERKPLRMSHYDYNSPGAYFLTLCTHNRKHILSHIVGAIHESPKPQLTSCGKIVDTILQNLPEHLHVTVDQYVIMPNHIHLIDIITEEDARRALRESPLQARSILLNVIGYIKMNASKAIRQHHGNIPVWQRGYFDHVIRSQADYVALAEYIQTNPLRWELDKLYAEE